MRRCFRCAETIPVERRASVFCSLRCEALNREMQQMAPPMDGLEEEGSDPAGRFSARYRETEDVTGSGAEPRRLPPTEVEEDREESPAKRFAARHRDPGPIVRTGPDLSRVPPMENNDDFEDSPAKRFATRHRDDAPVGRVDRDES